MSDRPIPEYCVTPYVVSNILIVQFLYYYSGLGSISHHIAGVYTAQLATRDSKIRAGLQSGAVLGQSTCKTILLFLVF